MHSTFELTYRYEGVNNFLVETRCLLTPIGAHRCETIITASHPGREHLQSRLHSACSGQAAFTPQTRPLTVCGAHAQTPRRGKATRRTLVAASKALLPMNTRGHHDGGEIAIFEVAIHLTTLFQHVNVCMHAFNIYGYIYIIK